MNHTDIKKHLADYLEGDLPIDDRALLDAHLDACDSCSGEVEEMLRTIRLLRTLPEPEIPPMIAANVIRRIRSGEGQLGFFGRIGRTLRVIFEPGFVLPASAIAAAALVITVVQGFSVDPISGGARDPLEGHPRSIDRGQSSVAPVAPSIASTRGGERKRASRMQGASGALNGMAFVARVERRATQSDLMFQVSRGEQAPHALVRSGPRIRIRLKGLGLARVSTPQASTSRTSQRSMSHQGPVLTSQISEMWATDFSRSLSGNASSVAFSGTGDLMTRAGMWPELVVREEFLTNERDPRDAWLALGFEDPAEFARYIAGRNLAEQELWAARLSERAEARGFLDEFLQTLRESGDPTAAWVADDFSAQFERARRRTSEDPFAH